jgi:hypothetical protein
LFISVEKNRKRTNRTIDKNIIFLFALLSLLLVAYTNLSGVGWSWDTSDYVAVGKN